MASGNQIKDTEDVELDSGTFVEICEEDVIIGADVAGGAVALSSPNFQLLQAANYSKEDQIRIYREFLMMVYPALYMSPDVFTGFMLDLGWQRTQCPSLFRAADVTGRGGLSFLELMLWTAALEPNTQHSGLPAEIRCRYIFRYFDSNRDLKLEYVEFKELIAAVRAARQLSIDALSVTRDADVCLRQLGIEPSSQLPLTEFLRGVSELVLRGTSSLLRAPRSIAAYLLDLQERERELDQLNAATSSKVSSQIAAEVQVVRADEVPRKSATASAGFRQPCQDYIVAAYTVKLRKRLPNDLLELSSFDGDLHGNLGALLAMEASLWPLGTVLTPAKILFLGDYVDRGAYGTELMAYLLAAKLQRPNGIFLVRGNHETRDIQKMFTFYNECVAKYGETDGNKIWDAINHVFDTLPLAAVVDDKVFCCHGGIPPPWVCPLISAIDKVPVPLPRPAEQSSIAWELLWNDPIRLHKMTATLAMELAANEGFAANAKRGTGHVFDQTALDRFLHSNHLSHVVRAHEMHQNGFMCQLKGRLVSVFSSHHYCGGNNDSGVVLLEGGKLRLIRVNTD